MQPKRSTPPWKHLMLTIAGVFLLFSLIYFSSCKKTDFAQQEQLTVVHDAHFKEQFFNTTSTNPTVLKIVGMLKAQNEKTDFISSLPAKCGLPIWDKLILPMNNSSTVNWGPEDSLENIIIPLTENNANLSSLLYAKETATSYDVSSYMVNDYLYNKCHGTNVDTVEATKALSTFFYMECRSFGTTQFKHIPANLFTYSPLDNDGLRSVTIEIDSNVSFPHGECVYEYILCPVCHLKTCPVTVIIPHCGDGWPSTGGGGGTPTAPGGGGTNVPPPTTPPSGPGQGGGGDGGGPTGTPCVPDFGDEAWYGLMPLPPNNPCAPDDPPTTPLPPCDQFVLRLEGDTTFIGRFQQLKSNAVLGASNETGYEIRELGQFNNTNYIYKTGSMAAPEIDWFLPSGTSQAGLIHAHYDNLNSIFSAQDIILMAKMFMTNHAKDSNNLFFGLTSAYGMPFLMKVGNTAKFRKFCEKIVGVNGNDVTKMRTFLTYYNDNVNYNDPDKNEGQFLKMIKNYGGEDGLNLYIGNDNCDKWTLRKVDHYGAVSSIQCNNN